MAIYRGFYGGFHCRHQWNEDHTDIRHVTHEEHGESWITLFIDLVYVAMFMSVGYILEYCGSAEMVMKISFVLFVIMFNSRLAIDDYSNRFFRDDIFHRLLYYVYTFGVFVMTLNINYTYSSHARRLVTTTDDHSTDDLVSTISGEHGYIGDCPVEVVYWEGLAWGFFITRGCLVVLYSMVCYANHEARSQFIIVVFRHFASLIAVATSLYRSHIDSYALGYYFAASIEVFFTILPEIGGALKATGIQNAVVGFLTAETYPLDIYDSQARLGVFYLMTLGESIIQILSRVYSVEHEREVYYFVAFAFLYVFSNGMQYFDAVHRPKGVRHAMRRSNFSRVLFVWAHPVLAFYMLTNTVGMVMMYISIQDASSIDNYFRRMVSLGAFCQVIVLILMRVEHKGIHYSLEKPTRIGYLLVRVCFAFAHLSLRYFKGSVERQMMFHGLLSLTVNFLDIFVSQYKADGHESRTMTAASRADAERNSSQETELGGVNPMVNRHH